MKPTSHKLAAIMIGVLVTLPSLAQDNDSNRVQTVEQLYPNLAAGVLTYAKVKTLPKGILLKTEGIEISSRDIDKSISGQPEQFQSELKKNAFFVLEQEATGKLLLKTVKQELAKGNKDIAAKTDDKLVKAFFENITKDINVSDQDVEKFYKENESVFCGNPLASVRKQIESYVLQDKQQRLIDRYIQTLGQKMEIFVSDSWTKKQAANAKDNPLDKARATGKPTLAIFSASSCCGPDKMIPVKEALLKKYDTKINIVYIEPRKEQILAARYGIRAIPAQVFYDNTGREFFRHSGFFSEKDTISKLSEMGIQ